jgi:phage shock protein PspC (stress-responsive transcriptional regulator)
MNIRDLKQQGWSVSAIAAQLGLDRKTVRMRWGLHGVAFVAALAYLLIHLQTTAKNGAAG